MLTPRIVVVLAAFACTAAFAAAPDLELIMSDPDWIGNPPTGAYWSDSGEQVYYRQERIGEDFSDLYVVAAGGGEAGRVAAADESRSSNATRVYNADRSRVAWILRDDIWVKDLETGAVRQITRTAAEEGSPMFMADGVSVAFLRDDVYFVHDSETGLTYQPVALEFEKDPDIETDFDALREHQLREMDTLREDKRQEEAAEAHARARERQDPAGPPLPVYLGSDYELVRQSLSPSGEYLLIVVKDADAKEGRKEEIPQYVTESGYIESEEARIRVGRNEPAAHTILLLDVATGTFAPVDQSSLPGIDDDPLAALRESALEWHVERGADREEVAAALEAPEQRPVNVEGIAWNRDGSVAALQLHSVDNKDRWLVTLAPAEGELELQQRLTDEAWINWQFNEFGWMPDDRTLWYLSEESGWSQLYTKAIDARRPEQLTSGEFIVKDPVLGPRGEWFYVTANRTHPGNYETYRVPAEGGELEQVTSLGGVVAFELSPAGDELLLSRSYIDRHEDLYVQRALPGPEALQITDTVSDEFKSIDWVIPQIVEVPSTHVDRAIYSKLYLPKDYEAGRTYPAVLFVHGAGYTQNSHMGWPYYFREFMFHTVLANDGYIVLDMDYRASEGYGRDWRTAIYRQMGHPELEDLEDGVAWLVENYGVDPQRVGIYGGFMTFMALFRAPGVFAAGAALRPVADWRHYNHEYTSNILNTPLVDPVAFEQSSPITFVENLEDPLLIASGMLDDNVFFQDSVMIVQRLIELKKQDFEIAIYPLDPHGFVHPESWLDEYRRIYELMNRYVGNPTADE
ncbi:MAG TPA: prolyl oligopeptidase family serine peptidase [Woeseiaceae bacterium]|nr:prolyl oligopeptidase family serine peptidase [Woeseiaceae bacterium]